MIGAATGMTTRKGTKQAQADPAAQLWVGSRRLTGNKTKVDRVDRSLKRRAQMYALMEEHPESAEELAARVKRAGEAAPLIEAKPLRVLRKAEKGAEDKIHAGIRKGEIVRAEDDRGAPIDTGTGLTVIKLRRKAIPKLVDQGKVRQEELDAAEEISLAFFALSSRLACRGINYDRVDNGRGTDSPWPARIAHAVARYQAFAKVWTRRNEDYGDPTLEIVIDAVIEEMYLSAIQAKHGYRPGKVEKALIGGLRDYAARAGFVAGHKAAQWQDEAAAVFGPALPELSKAIRRAAVEK